MNIFVFIDSIKELNKIAEQYPLGFHAITYVLDSMSNYKNTSYFCIIYNFNYYNCLDVGIII